MAVAEQLTCSSICLQHPGAHPCHEPFVSEGDAMNIYTLKNGDAFVHLRNDDLRTNDRRVLVAEESL
jgi:hypothetical protein